MANAINQPLAAVVANGHACERWLSQSPPNIARAATTLATIIQTGTRAGEVVQRVLDLVTKGKPLNHLLDINFAVVQVLRLQQADFQIHGIVVSTVLDPNLPLIRADLGLIEQVLLNLIRNAVEAMNANSSGPRELTIRSRHDDGDVVVEITDSGIGLSQDARLFEAFYTTKADGLGLGLAITKSIIESYSGTLWASHHAPTGSTFGFRLPAVPDAHP
jgi:signal transduction histidine kinase